MRQAVAGSLPRQVLAVDWSGALTGVRRKLWLAEVQEGELMRLECGRDRREVVDHLIECAAREPALLVGLDFAFSFPAWFLHQQGVARMPEAWELARREGERWLGECPLPFWGRPGRARPRFDQERSPFRATEGELIRCGGVGPKSVFQIGGAGAVGTGSLRGMPELARLRAAGFHVWPHDPPRFPLLVEIYPRHFTGRVTKSNRAARQLLLAVRHPALPPPMYEAAESSEDAFDAAVSVLAMARLAGVGLRIPEHAAEVFRLEGRIWRPAQDRLFPPPGG